LWEVLYSNKIIKKIKISSSLLISKKNLLIKNLPNLDDTQFSLESEFIFSSETLSESLVALWSALFDRLINFS